MNLPVLQTIKIRRLSLLRSHYLGSGRYRNLTTYYESMTIKRRHMCDTLSLTESPKLVISVPYELVGQGSPDQYNRPYRHNVTDRDESILLFGHTSIEWCWWLHTIIKKCQQPDVGVRRSVIKTSNMSPTFDTNINDLLFEYIWWLKMLKSWTCCFEWTVLKF